MRTKALQSFAGLFAEVLSVFLPVLVIWLGARQYQIDVRSSPEWAVGSIILFGQACVKFTTSIAKVKSARGPMSLIIVFLVCGIVVSCYLLVRATEIEHGFKVGGSLLYDMGYQQVIWFLVSSLIYILLGLLCDLAFKEPLRD